MCTFSSAVQPECAVVLRVFCLHVYKCVLNRLTFLLSSWISAWVTACLIWSCRQREKQSDFFNKQINITKIKLGKTVNKRLNKIMTLTSKSFISHVPLWTCGPVSLGPAPQGKAFPGFLPDRKPLSSSETSDSSPPPRLSHIHLSAGKHTRNKYSYIW